MAAGKQLDLVMILKLPGEGFKQDRPPLIKMDEAVKVGEIFGGNLC